MNKKHTAAVAQAMAQPDHQAQDESRRKRALEARRQRFIGRFALLGFVTGAAVAYFAHKGLFQFIGFGGAMGVIAGGAIASWPRAASRPNTASKRTR